MTDDKSGPPTCIPSRRFRARRAGVLGARLAARLSRVDSRLRSRVTKITPEPRARRTAFLFEAAIHRTKRCHEKPAFPALAVNWAVGAALRFSSPVAWCRRHGPATRKIPARRIRRNPLFRRMLSSRRSQSRKSSRRLPSRNRIRERRFNPAKANRARVESSRATLTNLRKLPLRRGPGIRARSRAIRTVARLRNRTDATAAGRTARIRPPTPAKSQTNPKTTRTPRASSARERISQR